MNKYKILTLDDKIPFGKYKGKEIWKILEDDSRYLKLCVDNLDSFELDNEAFIALQNKYS